MTKRELIQRHLEIHGWIDVVTAAKLYKAYRLADDIMKLERQGRVKCAHIFINPRYMKYLHVSKVPYRKAKKPA
jgi:hypothetical protein